LVLFSLFCFLQGIMCRKKPMNETTTGSSIQFYQLFLYFLEFEFFYFFLFYVLSLYLFLSLQQVYYMFWTVVKEYEITTKFYLNLILLWCVLILLCGFTKLLMKVIPLLKIYVTNNFFM
jgi:hypothetical protein